MKKDRFTSAYDSLIASFFDGTLSKGYCTTCAIGNIVARAQGIIPTRNNKIFDMSKHLKVSFWALLFLTSNGHQDKFYEKGGCHEEMNRLKDITGYTAEELAKVEWVFEQNTKIYQFNYPSYSEQEILEDQYNGLCAVFEVLCRLDGIIDSSYESELKKRLQMA